MQLLAVKSYSYTTAVVIQSKTSIMYLLELLFFLPWRLDGIRLLILLKKPWICNLHTPQQRNWYSTAGLKLISVLSSSCRKVSCNVADSVLHRAVDTPTCHVLVVKKKLACRRNPGTRAVFVWILKFTNVAMQVDWLHSNKGVQPVIQYLKLISHIHSFTPVLFFACISKCWGTVSGFCGGWWVLFILSDSFVNEEFH